MSQQRSRLPLETQILQALGHRRRLQHAHVRLKKTFRRRVAVFATAGRSLRHSAESSGPLGGDDQSQRGTENAHFLKAARQSPVNCNSCLATGWPGFVLMSSISFSFTYSSSQELHNDLSASMRCFVKFTVLETTARRKHKKPQQNQSQCLMVD